MSKQAFITGFLKRAQQHGHNEEQVLRDLGKQASAAYDKACDSFLNKQAVIGPLADIGAAGLPSALGAMIGHNYAPISDKELEEEMAYTEDPSISKLLKYTLIPGYTGYRAAKADRLDHAYQKYLDTQRAQAGQ